MERRFVSETFVIIDALFKDNGLASDYNSNWNNSNFTVARDGNGTTLTANQYATYFVDTDSSTVYDIPSPFRVEVDIVEMGNGFDFNIYDGTHNANATLSAMGITDNSHLTVISDGNTLRYYKDNNLTTPIYSQNWTMGNCRIGFRNVDTSGTSNSLKYKNLVIYPI